MEQDYWAEVSNYFLERKGCGAFLAPKDIMIIQEWHSEGIPLPVVLAGIEQAFHKVDSGKNSANMGGIFVCDKHVRDEWKQRNSSMEGMQFEFSAAEEANFFIFDQVKSFFQKKLAHALEEGNVAAVKAFKKISEGLKKNKQAWVDGDFFDAENEASLKEEIEAIVLRELCTCMSEDAHIKIRREAEEKLEKSQGVMGEKNIDITKCYLIKKETFSHFSLPKSPFWFI